MKAMKKVKFLLWIFLILGVVTSCQAQSRKATAQQPSYKIWNDLLHEYINDQGLVNYKGFIKDSAKLNVFLHGLSTHAPDPAKWSKDQRMAFWINAYNAFTVKLIIMHYPVKSIKDIGPKIQIYKISTPWQIKFFSIGSRKINLDDIEDKILRKEFDDPRIHFALVCAALSCPPLRNEAYTPDKLNAQLNDQGRKFLSQTFKNKISANKIELSSIFKWYKGDFTKQQSLISFLNRFAPVKIDPDASISYINYDWDLNKQ
ncbi:MAG: DUF547 domain-containing protein [Chitinophagaceae bacterium]